MANRKKTRSPRKPSRPLPKVGSPADDAYRLRHSRQDLLGFGRIGPRGATATRVVAVLALVALVLGLVGLIAIT